MNEIHLTKKDFRIDWFSGQGAGGQKRNKTQNCIRMTHIESGLTTVGTSHVSRVANQREAFNRLAKKVIAYYNTEEEKERYNATEVIRNYHAVRNEVLDKASGLKLGYKEVIDKGGIADMIEARKRVMGDDE